MTAQEQIANLVAVITRATTIDDSVVAFIEGVPGLITAAVTAAVANGATAEELQPVTDLAAAMDAKQDAIVTAMSANTPAARHR